MLRPPRTADFSRREPPPDPTPRVPSGWSRSRRKLWHKGEESGHQQMVKALRIDCDADVVLMEVEQKGGIACHTGRHHCFYRELDSSGRWVEIAPAQRVRVAHAGSRLLP